MHWRMAHDLVDDTVGAWPLFHQYSNDGKVPEDVAVYDVLLHVISLTVESVLGRRVEVERFGFVAG